MSPSPFRSRGRQLTACCFRAWFCHCGVHLFTAQSRKLHQSSKAAIVAVGVADAGSAPPQKKKKKKDADFGCAPPLSAARQTKSTNRTPATTPKDEDSAAGQNGGGDDGGYMDIEATAAPLNRLVSDDDALITDTGFVSRVDSDDALITDTGIAVSRRESDVQVRRVAIIGPERRSTGGGGASSPPRTRRRLELGGKACLCPLQTTAL